MTTTEPTREEVEQLRCDFEIARKASHMFEKAANAWMDRALKAEAALTSRPAPAAEVTGERRIIAVVLPDGYLSGDDFAKDCNVEVIGTCNENVFRRLATPSPDAGRITDQELQAAFSTPSDTGRPIDRVGLLRIMCHAAPASCACADKGGRVDDYEACRIVSRHANAILASDAGRVPEGWQLVPKNATTRMCEILGTIATKSEYPAKAWHDVLAMLAAAPQPNAKERE